MFWALAFPLILSIFFNISFGKDAFDDVFEKVPTALVKVQTDEGADENFQKYLAEFDGDMLEIKEMSEEKALKQLADGKVEGIFYSDVSLSVSSNGIIPSILETILDSYVKNEAMLTEIAKEHPERMADAVLALSEYREMTEDTTVGGRSLDTGIAFFFALMGMTCLYGCFPGIQTMMETRANLSALGARQCISPTNKLKRIVANCVVTYAVQFVNCVLVLCFVKYVLGVDFGGSMGGMMLICLLGSMIGVSLGIVVGAGGKMGEGPKIGILLAISMTSCFMGGLMSPDVKTKIGLAVPVINRINPASVISDAFYCLNVYDDGVKLAQCLITLAVMSGVLVIAGFLLVRRERYDSI